MGGVARQRRPSPYTAVVDCDDCRTGPAGIAGHDQLFSQTMAAGTMHFRCRDCGAVWVRLSDEGEPFRWKRSKGGYSGVDTPGRPGAAPP